jgi:hypothetical protein
LSSICFLRSDEFALVHMSRASDPDARASEIGAACPFPIRLAAIEKGGKAREAELARLFAGDRINSAWFSLSPALERYIARLEQERGLRLRI